MLDNFFKFLEKFVPLKWRWILNHDGFKRYFANTGWMFLGQMFSLVMAFFVGAWLARYLGPVNYGILSYVLAFTGLFAFIADLGIGTILSRELVAYPDKRDELLGTGFRLKLIGGLIAFTLVSLSALLLKDSLLVKSLIILFAFTFILQTVSVISLFFQARVESKKNVRAIVTATIISSLLKIAVILLGKGIIWIIIIYVLDSIWQGVGFIGAYKRSGLKLTTWRFNKELGQEIWHNSWPMMLTGAAYFIYLKIDQVMIGWFLGSQSVGLYAAAVKVVEIFYFIPSIVCTSLFPAIVNAKKVGLALYHSRLKNFYLLMLVISLVIALPVFLFSKFIILALFGNAYSLSISILQIYIWSSVGLFMGWAINYYLVSENMIRTIFIANLAAMLTNIVLNLILIPKIGLNGAALATLISYFVPPLLVFKFSKYWRKIEAER